jgi:hypothetical protein
MPTQKLVRAQLPFRITTPCYLGGPAPRDPVGLPHIRLRPLVAGWRTAFRALAGGVYGTTGDALRDIRRLEAGVFGNVHEQGGAPTGPARFRVRLTEERLGPTQEYTAKRDPVMNYIGYGLGSTRDDPARLGIPPDSTFAVELLCEESLLPCLTICNYVFATCFGLGARTTRGLGSLEWQDSAANPGPQVGWFLKDAREGFGSVLKRAGLDLPEVRRDTEPAFPVVHPQFLRVKCAGSYRTWRDALTAIRNQLRLEATGTVPPVLHLGVDGYGYRQGDGLHHSWEKVWKELPNGRRFPYFPSRDKESALDALAALERHEPLTQPPLFVNPLFGLPVEFSGWGLGIKVRGEGDGAKPVELRRPSPMVFRVLRDGASYRVLVLYFRSRFLPEKAKVVAALKRREVPIALPRDWSYLDRFFNQISGEEVPL